MPINQIATPFSAWGQRDRPSEAGLLVINVLKSENESKKCSVCIWKCIYLALRVQNCSHHGFFLLYKWNRLCSAYPVGSCRLPFCAEAARGRRDKHVSSDPFTDSNICSFM